jgi:hypothetical protein
MPCMTTVCPTYVIENAALQNEDTHSLAGSTTSSCTLELEAVLSQHTRHPRHHHHHLLPPNQPDKRFTRAIQQHGNVIRQLPIKLSPVNHPSELRQSKCSHHPVGDKLTRQKSSEIHTYQGQDPNQNKLADLLAARARKEELRSFLLSCQDALHHRPFVNMQRRCVNVASQ